jgi:quinol monooxygenase YgiN
VITIIAKLTAAEGKADEMHAALEMMVAGVDTNEPDVAAYSLHTVDDDPNVFYFYEQYDNAAAPLAHRQTEDIAPLGAALQGVAGARPEITRPRRSQATTVSWTNREPGSLPQTRRGAG